MARIGFAALAVLFVLLAPRGAHAFCGFYVSGADAKLFNNATQVALMREGTRTVLSMQNNYQGPPEAFAMVVPVPVVLQKENVRTLPSDLFARLDELTAPRLVEYWEQDPCAVRAGEIGLGTIGGLGKGSGTGQGYGSGGGLGVKVEAKFAVGEYEIVILSAQDSAGLDAWLRAEKYAIPAGAEPYLRPYVAAGSKFFVAKVDPKKVAFKGGQATLSPLRVYYDAETFTLPVRLGLINSAGTQDLIAYVFAKSKRYEVSNYPNVFVPTNLDVSERAKDRFGEFYAALFDRVIERSPKAVVTEYAWDPAQCDPCPRPPLDAQDLATLGADVIAGGMDALSPGGLGGLGSTRFVLTRLHARYARDVLGEDLAFRAADPVVGGREMLQVDGGVEMGTVKASTNAFQARYVIRHAWTGPVKCESPVRGVWGARPAPSADRPKPASATGLASAERGQLQLSSYVNPKDVPELRLGEQKVTPTIAPASASGLPVAPPKASAEAPSASSEKKGCAGCSATGADLGAGAAGALLFALVAAARRRR